ncbi:MAG: hypothetical protein QN784_10915 [Nitrososphaeraceae archaeon]|nr:hypothetical protein [Nitrososphaeraceae archaeon]MDW0222432.1 hypothetical protein [Nitrososphaeraceae archaeon]MDW0247343.1 hypothetical protein [Nitrososphaeraceae archaeon]MDW0298952.1 hypothetical protein [Nitrososphaeraceae archaeon]
MLLKHSILVKVFGFVAVLLVTKAAIHQFELDLVTIGPLVTAFVGGGVIFIIAIILACTLSDYKVKKSHWNLPHQFLFFIRTLGSQALTMRGSIRCVIE